MAEQTQDWSNFQLTGITDDGPQIKGADSFGSSAATRYYSHNGEQYYAQFSLEMINGTEGLEPAERIKVILLHPSLGTIYFEMEHEEASYWTLMEDYHHYYPAFGQEMREWLNNSINNAFMLTLGNVQG